MYKSIIDELFTALYKKSYKVSVFITRFKRGY